VKGKVSFVVSVLGMHNFERLDNVGEGERLDDEKRHGNYANQMVIIGIRQ